MSDQSTSLPQRTMAAVCRDTLIKLFLCAAVTINGYESQIANAAEAVKGNIRADGSLLIHGQTHYEEFGGPAACWSELGPCGLKCVSVSKHIYVAGEQCPALLIVPPEIEKSRTDPLMNPDPRKLGGWYKWYGDLSQQLAQRWSGRIPGRMQLVMKITAERKISLEPMMFIPGTDQNNKFVTQKKDPLIEDKFLSSLNALCETIAESEYLEFPTGSTAKEILALVDFGADHDLFIDYPDLRTLKDIPPDLKALRIMRICSLFDSASLFELSDHVRSQLPAGVRHRFIPDTGRHNYRSSWPGLMQFESISDCESRPLDPTVIRYAEDRIDYYLDREEYVQADILAKHIATDYCMYVSFSYIRAKNKSPLPVEPISVARIQSRENRIDAELKLPAPAEKEW